MTNHNWGDWKDSGNGEAHIGVCQNDGCDAKRADLHNWVIGSEEHDGKHVCAECGAAENHSWESEVYQAPNCIAEGAGNRTCPICGAQDLDFTIPLDPDAHNWGEWIVVKEPDEGVEGEEKCVCAWAPNDHVQTRPIPALEHEHIWSDWEPWDDLTHRQHCLDEKCSDYTEEEHDLAEEEVLAPDYGIPGQNRIYCQVCWYERMEEGESASVTLTIGTENARKLANQELLLVHIDGLTRKIYALDELIIDVEAGTVTFVTDSFSPFVLAAPPEQFAVTVDGKAVSGGCEVTVSANASYVCNLLIAVYDAEKMVAVKVVGNCNLTAPQKFELNFGAEADSVKAFLLEADSGFVPRRAAAEDINLNT